MSLTENKKEIIRLKRQILDAKLILLDWSDKTTVSEQEEIICKCRREIFKKHIENLKIMIGINNETIKKS